jgi:glutaminyl-tRNA synthetase
MSADSPAPDLTADPVAPSDFIRDIVARHVAEGRYPGIVTRFPPEPNGYLHIGHARSICLNFGLAREHGGRCHLRMDDTNPAKEEMEYVRSITADVRWLIQGWADAHLALKPVGATPAASADGDCVIAPARPGEEAEPFFASDYFEALYTLAEHLIEKGRAFVCDLSAEETDAHRGTPTEPGRDSPYRNRTVAENLDLFRRMRAGEFPDGARTLRAKIDMAAANIWLRDPLLYRIRHVPHHHTGDRWCLYPLYDYAHCLSDYLEGITHSVCTLEFEVHRPLYDWILASLELPRPVPHQYEFAKLIPSHCIVSKRKLMRLVADKIVAGWDDPRLPTLAGLRRRGVPARALRRFVIGTGITKYDGLTDLALFEHVLREDLNHHAPRRLAVLRPLKLVLTNLGPDESIPCQAVNHPKDGSQGTRPLRLTRELYIEADDFAEEPPPKFFRLKPGGEVRLKYGCIIQCTEVVKNHRGEITTVHAVADLNTRTGGPAADRKVKGTIHWLSAADARPAEVRLYDRLFTAPEPDADGDFTAHLNPASLEVVTARVEPALAEARAGQVFQCERLGYFTPDAVDHTPEKPVFNRTIGLRDTWSK